MKSPNKNYIHDPTFRHSGLASSSGVNGWTVVNGFVWKPGISMRALGRECNFGQWFHSFNKTRVAVIILLRRHKITSLRRWYCTFNCFLTIWDMLWQQILVRCLAGKIIDFYIQHYSTNAFILALCFCSAKTID